MPRREHEIVVVGAGVAGLTAAACLAQQGKDVVCLEATERVGGRIYTVHDRLSPHPIELGAEFVHGLPPETWEWIRRAGLTVYEQSDDDVHLEGGEVRQPDEGSERVIAALTGHAPVPDESFEEYLRQSRRPKDVQVRARAQVEGFNAARSEVISAAALGEEASAADQIEGGRSFRILNGYDSVVDALLRSMPGHGRIVHLHAAVEKVEWRRGRADVTYRSRLTGDVVRLRCRRLIVTVPLGVLQARAIVFDPAPDPVLQAADSLQFGQVYRITFRFRDPFWAEAERLKRVGFLLSNDAGFGVWWTTQPVITPLLTGWSAGSAADRYRALDETQIVASALQSLARILGREVPTPEAAYFHNWEHDPYFRGAYSYVPVNAGAARRELARPVDDTLFFAGEAAEAEGHASTVHGAIRSGMKAAELVIQARP